jgi:hypothetical protein
MTSALDGGEESASRPSRFTSRKEPPVPTGQEAVRVLNRAATMVGAKANNSPTVSTWKQKNAV